MRSRFGRGEPTNWSDRTYALLLQSVGCLAHELVIGFTFHAEGRSTEGFGIVGAGEVAVVDQNELIQDEGGDPVELDHEGGMDVDVESGAWVLAPGNGIGELTGFELRGIKDHLTGITDVAGILEKPLEFGPAEERAVLGVDLGTLGRRVGGEGLAGVVDGELGGHGMRGLIRRGG